jgi:hypothetical protein
MHLFFNAAIFQKVILAQKLDVVAGGMAEYLIPVVYKAQSPVVRMQFYPIVISHESANDQTRLVR